MPSYPSQSFLISMRVVEFTVNARWHHALFRFSMMTAASFLYAFFSILWCFFSSLLAPLANDRVTSLEAGASGCCPMEVGFEAAVKKVTPPIQSASCYREPKRWWIEFDGGLAVLKCGWTSTDRSEVAIRVPQDPERKKIHGSVKTYYP